MKCKHVSRLFSAPIALLLLSACATAPSSAPVASVQLDVPAYSKAFTNRLADLIEADTQPPCDRLEPAPRGTCSALKTIISDYGYLRDQARALEKI
jgi:hypothetical protein